jgi:hypothetical protein
MSDPENPPETFLYLYLLSFTRFLRSLNVCRKRSAYVYISYVAFRRLLQGRTRKLHFVGPFKVSIVVFGLLLKRDSDGIIRI